MTVPVYQWQPSTANIAKRAGIDPSAVIRFDHNTAPDAPLWVEEEASRAAAASNEYPAADYVPLREAVARYHEVTVTQVVTGAGADEMIDLCAKTFLPPGGRTVVTPPTYPLYRIAAAQRDAEILEIPRHEPGFSLDVPATIIAAAAADLVWLCAPNNPTGNRDDDPSLATIIDACPGIVVLDAAYAEFSGDRWSAWLDRFPNLVVLGTLSKAFGLAAIRVGYAVTGAELAARLHDRRPPGSVSSISAALATRALNEPEPMQARVEAVIRERTRLASSLAALGLEVPASSTNFLLARVGAAAADIAGRLMWERGLVVRSFWAGPLAGYLRCTVRKPDEDDRLLAALEEVLP